MYTIIKKARKEDVLFSARYLNDNVPLDSVIDDNWWDYFLEDTEKLIHLLVITGESNYAEVLRKHEGKTLAELLQVIEEDYDVAINMIELEEFQIGWTIEIDGQENVYGKDFHDAAAELEYAICKDPDAFIHNKTLNVRTYRV